jgi:hypothetical protein
VGTWSPPSSAARKRLRETLPIINKHLAHLTWERVDDGQQPWDHRQLVPDVLLVFGELVAEATTQNARGAGTLELALTMARAAHLTSDAAGTVATTTSSGRQSR